MKKKNSSRIKKPSLKSSGTKKAKTPKKSSSKDKIENPIKKKGKPKLPIPEEYPPTTAGKNKYVKFTIMKVVKGFTFNGKSFYSGDMVISSMFRKSVFAKMVLKDIVTLCKSVSGFKKFSHTMPIVEVEEMSSADIEEFQKLYYQTTGAFLEQLKLRNISLTDLTSTMKDEFQLDDSLPKDDKNISPNDSKSSFKGVEDIFYSANKQGMESLTLSSSDMIYHHAPAQEVKLYSQEAIDEKRMTEEAAAQYASKFSNIFNSGSVIEKENLPSGSLEDVVSAMVDGKGFHQEVFTSLGNGFEMSVMLDVSGSTYSNGLFPKICQAGYFMNQMSKEIQSRGVICDCQTGLFATSVVSLTPDQSRLIVSALDYGRGPGSNRYHLDPAFSEILGKLGDSTSLFTAAELGLKAFIPKQYGIFFLFTDLQVNSEMALGLEAYSCPPNVTPILVSLAYPIAPNIVPGGRWHFHYLKANTGAEMLGYIQNELDEKLREIVLKEMTRV